MKKAIVAAIACACASAVAGPRLRVFVGNDLGDHAPIFLASERAVIARAVVAFLVHAGEHVVPADDIDRLVLAAREGRNLATGATCGEPVAPELVIQNVLPDVKPAGAAVSCSGKGGTDCALVVRTPTAGYRVAVPAHAMPAQVVAAAKHLRRAKLDDGEEGGVEGGVAGLGVLIGVTDTNGAWAANPYDSLHSHQAAFDACLTDERRSNVANAVLLDVAPSGAVAACEPDDDDELPIAGLSCMCHALGDVDFGAGHGVRRLKLDVSYITKTTATRTNGKRLYAALQSLTAADPTALWAQTGVSDHAVAECLKGAGPLPPQLTAHWHVDATGHPKATTAVAPGAAPDVVHCVETALATATFACPQAGSDVDVTGVYSFTELR
jgi:hypothetical protein